MQPEPMPAVKLQRLGVWMSALVLMATLLGCSAATTSRSDSAVHAPQGQVERFVESLLVAPNTRWRALVSAPMSWNRRCAWLGSMREIGERVDGQRPPLGAVKVVRVSQASPQAARPLLDLSTTCGSAALDKQQQVYVGRRHRVFHVLLKTPYGPHDLYVRVTSFERGWLVTGLIG